MIKIKAPNPIPAEYIAQLFSLFVKVSEYAIEMVGVEMLGDRHFSAK